jgi:hypothetical protein
MKVEIEFPQKYVDYAKEQGLTESEIEKILKQEIEMAMGIGDFVWGADYAFEEYKTYIDEYKNRN